MRTESSLSVSLQTIVSSQHYPNFLETAIPIFLQLLREGTVEEGDESDLHSPSLSLPLLSLFLIFFFFFFNILLLLLLLSLLDRRASSDS